MLCWFLLLLLGTITHHTVDAAVRATNPNTMNENTDEMDTKVDVAAANRNSNHDSNDSKNNDNDKNAGAHPDLNAEDHVGMMYVGRLCPKTGR